jgi:preprotein translocase subunit SecD
MHTNPKNRLIAIFVISLICLYISLPKNFSVFNFSFQRKDLSLQIGSRKIEKNFDLKQGLDLIGGSRLIFQADLSSIDQKDYESALESLKTVIEKRVNLFGVSEPNIQLSTYQSAHRIIVELPGINNTREAISLVGQTAQLVFVEVQNEEEITPTDLTGADLKSASVSFDNVTASPIVLLNFTSKGAEKFAQITERNIGKPLPILLDNQIVSAPTVQSKISGGSAQITGDFTLDQAKELSIQLNAGALPIPINLLSETTVGASLGQQSIQKSIKAGLLGLLAVFVFMILFYGKMGLVANIGLVIFGIITLALYKLIPVVLTLPGIAGFLLSVGMAVDSNILIFERFKEEKQKGINTLFALETSFGRAWDSIRDANIATLSTAFILANPFNWSFLHISGPVRGFALTLALGIAVGLFTGIFVSRNLLRLIYAKSHLKKDTKK